MRARRLLSQAQQLTAKNEIGAALATFDRLLTKGSVSPGVYLHWALALSEAGRLQPAIEAMQNAMEQQPTHAALPMFLGQILFDHADYAEARSWCKKALILNPQQWRAAALLGLIDIADGHILTGYQQLQQPQYNSLSILEQLLRWCGVRPPTVYQQTSSAWKSRLLLVIETELLKRSDSVSLATQLTQTSPEILGNSPPSWIDRALTRTVLTIQRGMYWLRYARRPHQRDAWLHYTQAEEAYYLEQLDAAARLYHQLDANFPAVQTVQQRLYDIAYAQGDFRLALKYWRQYLNSTATTQPLKGWEAFQLGELHYQVGEFALAQTAFEHATPLPWSDYRLSYYQGLYHLREGATQAARLCFTETFDLLNPDIITLRLDALYRTLPASSPNALVPHSTIPHI